jgi:hypothetical protein
MIYVCKSLQELADMLRKLGQNGTPEPGMLSAAERLGWNNAARVVEAAGLVNPPIAEEYAREYADAQFAAAVHIWASIQRHKGDPRWQWACEDSGGRCEVCT